MLVMLVLLHLARACLVFDEVRAAIISNYRFQGAWVHKPASEQTGTIR